MTLPFTLIICTYMRPEALHTLLKSVSAQSLYPDEILIIDGSTNSETEDVLKITPFNNLKYFKVPESDRGLTKQRNYGISRVAKSSEVVCFLDDDTVLESDYFEALLSVYRSHPEALAVGGYITNEINWEREALPKTRSHFYYDGWQRTEPSRFKIRRAFGLLPDTPPGFMPSFSHGRSIGFLPPSGNIYPVEQLMGGVSSYKKEIFKTLSFSTYFEGYGLYEDADFSLRIAKMGKLFVTTKARLEHHHNAAGRPNQYAYGKMVVRNGWYVWRVKYTAPSVQAIVQWHATALLLTAIRFLNVFTTSQRKEALTESCGRVVGWLSLFTNSPKSK
ncbi:glycosyltransferase family 2 protein [Bizionia gelidisalsuginis]|uniref:Glycosyltransferase family 2 protein n=1 Tax=Bizionia gelidisalsuginis TaxID=291188 RepID=A0ABY3MDI8_9FLAO|nr:glycosyltransferase family 2 protein [Bizionia gelidisalsuginis]TYC17001.1 glycosyltransferase family 2 protein [Bizionia gelidisalsuginis]